MSGYRHAALETAGEKGPRSARLSLQLGNTAITWLLIQSIEME